MGYLFPGQLQITDNGSYLLIESNNPIEGVTEFTVPKASYQVEYLPDVAGSEAIHLRPLSGAKELGYILHANVSSPVTVNTQELMEVLLGFFNVATPGAISYAGTYQEVMGREDAGTLPDGLILITDRAHGGVYLPSRNSSLGTNGWGLFYDIDWNRESEWYAGHASGLIAYDNLAGGVPAPGDPVSDGNGWQGIVTGIDSNFISAYQAVGGFPWPSTGTVTSIAGWSCDVTGGTAPEVGLRAWRLVGTGYKMYRVHNPEQLNGLAPDQWPAAWELVPPSGAGGFVPSLDSISFCKRDVMGGPMGYVERRDNKVVDARYDARLDSIYGLGFSALDLIAWGSTGQALSQSPLCQGPDGLHRGVTSVTPMQIMDWTSNPIPLAQGVYGTAYFPRFGATVEYTCGTTNYGLVGLMGLTTNSTNYFGICDGSSLIGAGSPGDVKFHEISNAHGAGQINPYQQPALAANIPMSDGFSLIGEPIVGAVGDGVMKVYWWHSLAEAGSSVGR